MTEQGLDRKKIEIIVRTERASRFAGPTRNKKVEKGDREEP